MRHSSFPLWCVLLTTVASLPLLHAQNLLTNNAGFEASLGYYTPAWGFPQGSPEVVPGWLIALDSAADGYAGTAANQSPAGLEGNHFAYLYSGSGSAGILETLPGSRAVVQKDLTYTLWFLARGDTSWSEASATVSLVWYANENGAATQGETNLNITLPARQATDDPMQTFVLIAVAPPGAHYAGVRVSRPPYDYTAIIVDDFVLMAEPTETLLAIEPQGANAKVSWARSRKYRLETASSLSASNGWERVNQPVKGIGAMNHVNYPITGPIHFFRLVPSN